MIRWKVEYRKSVLFKDTSIGYIEKIDNGKWKVVYTRFGSLMLCEVDTRSDGMKILEALLFNE